MQCENCEKEHDGLYGSGRFCSRSCANTRILSKETKKKISNSRSGVATRILPRVDKICPVCNSKFNVSASRKMIKGCSKECSKELQLIGCRKGGQSSAAKQSETRRSKNEKYFSELCKEYFKSVKTNEPIFNGWDADVIIEDLKIAVLWNGKWHYEKITKKHSVKQVQNRDRIKIKEIDNCGYVPYVIKDMGRYDRLFVEKKFKEFLYDIDGGQVTKRDS